MPLQLTIPDEKTAYLNEPAKEELVAAIESYSDRLLREASRLEAATSTTGTDPEITSTMVRDADLLLKRAYRKPKKKPAVIVGEIVGPTTGLIAGMLANMKLLQSPVLFAIFIVLLAISVTSTVLVVRE